MAFPIKFLSLQKSELEYEVAIRGSTPCTTVQDLRKQIAKLGPLFPSEDILDSPFDAAEDLTGVSDALTKIETSLESASDKNTLLRTQNLLYHLYHRINRIISYESVKPQYDACVLQFKKYFEIFNNIKDKGIDPLIPSGNGESSTPALPMNIAVTCDRGGSNELCKLKYDGKTCVRAFIQRITEFCEARNIPGSKALSYATEIFTGDALHWYRSVKNRVFCWSDLIFLLRQDFDQSDFDYRLLSEIRARSQGETENITIYLSIMSGLFSRLSKTVPEDEKLEIILHNIRPCYASTLASVSDIKTLDSLQTLCRNYENIQSRLANFREPSTATSNTLAPEFSYNGNRNKTNNTFKSSFPKQNFNTSFNKNQPFANRNHYNYTNKTNYQNTNYPKTSNTNNYSNKTNNEKYLHAIEAPKARFCPRCRVDTHNLRQCTNKDIFCFKCGRKNVKTPQCPDCNVGEPSSSKN